ncbi:hypothetical protein D049_4451A, partial [Vibrio parahaemolyticus VPTS-2010]
MHRTQ